MDEKHLLVELVEVLLLFRVQELAHIRSNSELTALYPCLHHRTLVLVTRVLGQVFALADVGLGRDALNNTQTLVEVEE
jgi:hypothetical protein